MSVRVRWFATLAPRTRAGQAAGTADWRPGLTPLDVFLGEGFAEHDADGVLPVVNGHQAEMDTALADSDEVEFLVGIQGG